MIVALNDYANYLQGEINMEVGKISAQVNGTGWEIVEKKPDVVHKVSDEYVSTGVCRTAEHENIKEVYANKSKVYIFLKRLFDIALACIALVILSPLFLITAIAIKLEDKGPVFFTQQRAGKDLVPFKMYKFRSMYVNADKKFDEMMKNNEQTGHAFKIKNDPRITKVGKVIRRLSIDELPQLINVIKGDMSIVGPRPILLFQMEECDAYDRQRLTVQPGLTCYWQIGGRANIKWDEWVELDLNYVEDMSLWTDIKMIVKTVPVIFVGDGAY
jgi:exopolysaccharide biosynthesis polyprenyl glycosylphosphotransferase